MDTPTLPTEFDIDTYEDTETGRVVIKDPITGQPTPLVFVMAGPEHPIRKKIELDRQRKARAAFQKTGKLQFQDPLEEEADETDKLVACTLDIEGLVRNGTTLKFTKAVAEAALTDPKRRWLRAQVKAGFDERENFIGRSATP